MTIEFDNPQGATPIHDMSYLKLTWVQTQYDLNRAEAENIAAAQKKYLKKSPKKSLDWFNSESLKDIHKADVCFRDRSGYDPFELAISLDKLKIAQALYLAGYPYQIRMSPTPKLLSHSESLYRFEMQLK